MKTNKYFIIVLFFFLCGSFTFIHAAFDKEELNKHNIIDQPILEEELSKEQILVSSSDVINQSSLGAPTSSKNKEKKKKKPPEEKILIIDTLHEHKNTFKEVVEDYFPDYEFIEYKLFWLHPNDWEPKELKKVHQLLSNEKIKIKGIICLINASFFKVKNQPMPTRHLENLGLFAKEDQIDKLLYNIGYVFIDWKKELNFHQRSKAKLKRGFKLLSERAEKMEAIDKIAKQLARAGCKKAGFNDADINKIADCIIEKDFIVVSIDKMSHNNFQIKCKEVILHVKRDKAKRQLVIEKEEKTAKSLIPNEFDDEKRNEKNRIVDKYSEEFLANCFKQRRVGFATKDQKYFSRYYMIIINSLLRKKRKNSLNIEDKYPLDNREDKREEEINLEYNLQIDLAQIKDMIKYFKGISHDFFKKEFKEVQTAIADHENHERLFDESLVPEKTRLGYNKQPTKAAEVQSDLLLKLIVAFGLTTSCATLYLFWKVFISARSSNVKSNATSIIKINGGKTAHKNDQPLVDWDIIFFMLLILGILSLGYQMIFKPKKRQK